ncbi:hypothetical protein [Agrococcus baldri]|uniref:Uncharacterized protein n=1 Tax=Agrococcus baldri TaxID=153730 RepID=A0AA87RF67_9MICO|nr:hypothetical protein [Agrococcus baldri]GEK81562.1 hypothetical protein ABA31_29130 [Agrococcus baldri]
MDENQFDRPDQPGPGETGVPEGARPVHPDGEVDAPLGETGTGAGAGQYGGTTGAEHDGGGEQVAAESQDAEASLDGRSPQGADEPLQGGTDRLEGAGSPVEGAGSATEQGGAPAQDRSSPAQGLGPSDAGAGSPVRQADSPEEGTGATQGGAGSPVQPASSPGHGLGADDPEAERAEREADPLG